MSSNPHRWQAPGNAKGFNTTIGNTTQKIKNRINLNNRTIGTLKYIKEQSNQDGFISEKVLKEELKNYLYQNFYEEKTDSLVTHFYKPALFYGFIVRDKNYNLSLSIEGNLFVNSYEKKDFYSCKRILINQLDNTTYPNSSTPDVKNLKIFPFRIFFKLLLENEKLSSSFIKEKLIYISLQNDLIEYSRTHNLLDIKEGNYYEKFNSWVINSLVDIEILDLQHKYISINKEIVNHIKSLYDNLQYSDMFFNDVTCQLNKNVADKRVKRDASLIAKAKKRDDFRCVINPNHQTFYSKGEKYVEGHHIIPLFQQKNYNFKLDTIENIISLCPNCHREIHFSDNKEELLKQIFFINNKFMKKNEIDLNDFYKMYNCFNI